MSFAALFKKVRTITAGELRSLLDAGAPGEVLLVDVRERAEYAGGHIPGALHVPLSRLAERGGEIDRSRPVITY